MACEYGDGYGLPIPLAKSHPNNEYNHNECYRDGWDHPHDSVLADFPLYVHNEMGSEMLSPAHSVSNIVGVVRRIQGLGPELGP